MGSACATCYGDAKDKSDKDEFSTSDPRVMHHHYLHIPFYFT